MKKILLLITIFILTGCYDYHELNNLNIVNSIGIDYQDDNYIVYLEIIKNKEKNEYETITIKGQDNNIAPAFKKAINNSDKEIYLKQSRLLLLSESICQNKLTNIISYLLNDNTLSNNYLLSVTNNIEYIFQKDNTTNTIINTLKNNNNSHNIDDIEKITGDLFNPNKDIAIPYININDNKIDTSQIAYFKEDKLTNYINKKIYNFLIKNDNNTEFSFNNNTITIYKKKIKNKVKGNKVIIDINGYGYINQLNNDINLKDNNSYKQLEQQLNKTITKEINEFLNTTLNNKSDLLSLKDIYYKFTNSTIDNIQYEINTNIKIDKNGNLYEGLYD